MTSTALCIPSAAGELQLSFSSSACTILIRTSSRRVLLESFANCLDPNLPTLLGYLRFSPNNFTGRLAPSNVEYGGEFERQAAPESQRSGAPG